MGRQRGGNGKVEPLRWEGYGRLKSGGGDASKLAWWRHAAGTRGRLGVGRFGSRDELAHEGSERSFAGGGGCRAAARRCAEHSVA